VEAADSLEAAVAADLEEEAEDPGREIK
jgi:hypothetical protein